ncbi:cyclic pyranopterin monophosphate synthase MoaC, partial [Campylobacter sp. BCW_8712]
MQSLFYLKFVWFCYNFYNFLKGEFMKLSHLDENNHPKMVDVSD